MARAVAHRPFELSRRDCLATTSDELAGIAALDLDERAAAGTHHLQCSGLENVDGVDVLDRYTVRIQAKVLDAAGAEASTASFRFTIPLVWFLALSPRRLSPAAEDSRRSRACHRPSLRVSSVPARGERSPAVRRDGWGSSGRAMGSGSDQDVVCCLLSETLYIIIDNESNSRYGEILNRGFSALIS